MQPVSPLTAFAKSVRNEQKGGAQEDDPSKAAHVQYIDPSADFDLDELPADQKTKLEKLLADHKALYGKNTELEARRQKAEEFARLQQSQKDKLQSIVQRHNLPTDGNPPTDKPNSADAKISAIEARFIADGLDPVQAKSYAKLFASAGAIERENLLRELGPLVGSVGNIQAQQHLDAAKADYPQVFSVPELAKQVNDNVALLVQQGNPVDSKTVNHLISMAWGQYSLTEPDAAAKKLADMNQQQQQQAVPQFRNGLPAGGGHVSRANKTADGAPIATQPETLNIMGQIGKFLTADLPSANKKK